MRSVASLLLIPMGCSFGNIDVTECASDNVCRDLFGLGSTCSDDGTCSEGGLHPRCSTTPDDLFESSNGGSDTIVLGHLWRNQTFDTEQRAVQLAILHANDNQGLDGTRFGLVSCDTEANDNDELDGEAATSTMAAYLAEDLGIPAIVGATSSPETEAAFTVTNAAGSLLISPSSTSPALTNLDGLTCSDTDPGLLWRTVPPDELQGQVIAQNLMDRDVQRISVVYELGSYGEGLADAIDKSFNGNLNRIAFADEADIGEAAVNATQVDAGPPIEEVVFITSSVDFVEDFLLAAAPLQPYQDMPLFLADAAYNQDIYDNLRDTNAEDLFDQIMGTRPTIDESSSVLQTFVASFSVEFNGEDATGSGFSAYAYDAGWLAIYGTAWSHYQENEVYGLGIARGLRRLSSGIPINVQSSSWNDIRAQFKQGQSIDLTGASGALDYDTETCETSAPIEIWTVNQKSDGSWELTTLAVID